MKPVWTKPLLLLLVAAALTAAAAATANAKHLVGKKFAANDLCQAYGYAAGTHAYWECRLNVRRYWTTGPCGDSGFASVHRRYCNIIPEADF